MRKNSSVRSLVTLTPLGPWQPVTFWSSADFALLSGFGAFETTDGQTHSLIMSWSIEIPERLAEFTANLETEGNFGEIPDLPVGEATFVVLSPNPDAQTISTVRSLHALYNNEYQRLASAYQGREIARLQREAELKANPPVPKDMVIRQWRLEHSVNGGDQ